LIIKVCGNTNIENLKEVCKLDIDFLGFINVSKSPRFVDIPKIKELLAYVPSRIKKVLVTVDMDIDTLNKILSFDLFDYVQLHGAESLEYVIQVKCKIIKAFRIKDQIPDSIQQYLKIVDYVLLDTYNSKNDGGTGETFDWDLLRALNMSKVIVAGGISASNYKNIIKFNPAGIDINSRVEIRAGIKDITKIKEVIKGVRSDC
jgi:phosphoribosylanthranilate isomerase